MNVPTTALEVRALARLVLKGILLVVSILVGAVSYAQSIYNLTPGWNLLGNATAATVDPAVSFGDPNSFLTVWKWNAAQGRWAIFITGVSPAALSSYAQTNGFDVLTAIHPKEGFWVNAVGATTILGPVSPPPSPGSGTPTLTLQAADLTPGWNLVSSSDAKTPSALSAALESALLASGKRIVTIWAWDATSNAWKFFAPSLEQQGGSALSDYINSQGHLPFGASLRGVEGYWVNVVAMPTNTAPLANAGTEQYDVLGSSITLDGTASDDADGNQLMYVWRLASIPTGSRVQLSSAQAASPTFTPDLIGTYSAALVVNDGYADSAVSTVNVTVNSTCLSCHTSDAAQRHAVLNPGLCNLCHGSGTMVATASTHRQGIGRILTDVPANLAVALGATKTYRIYGGTKPYTVTSSNPAAISASVSGSASALSLTANATGSATLTISDSKGATTAVTITGAAVALFADAPASLSMAIGASNFYSIAGGTKPYTVSSSNTATVTASLSSNGTTLALAGNTTGTARIAVSDGVGSTVLISVTIPPPSIIFSDAPAGLFLPLGSSRIINIFGGRMPYAVTSMAPSSVSAVIPTGSSSLTLTGYSVGSTSIVVTDVDGSTLVLNVTVPAAGALYADASALTIPLGASSTFNVYGGYAPYTITTTNSALVSAAISAATVRLTANASTGGAATVSVFDSTGANIAIAVSVPGLCSASGYTASNASSKSTVCMMTDKGEIVLELDAGAAPITAANFLQYANAGFYSGTIFHRVISNFMIQGGGFTYASGAYTQKSTNAAIALESPTTTGLSNLRGTIAMARTNLPNTATSQFFINVVDNLFLNGSTATDGYAVFGRVISGLDVVDQIKQVAVQTSSITGTEVSSPVTPMVIQWAYQLK